MKKMLSFLLAFSMVCSSLAISAQAEEVVELPEQADQSAQATEPISLEEASADELLAAAEEAETVAEPESAPEAFSIAEAEAYPELDAVPAPETSPELASETVAEAQPEEIAASEDVELETYQEGGFEYTTSGSEASITGYTGNSATVSIPETIGGCTVTSIGYYSFSGHTEITKLVIPKSVKTLYFRAFEGCTGLTDVTINATNLDSVNQAFFNSGAMKVTFGEGVKKIPEYLFYADSSKSDNQYCHIVSVKMSSTIVSVGDNAFLHCYDLNEVVWGSGLETIGEKAFYGLNLKTVVLPEGLKTIENYAFNSNASLTKLVIPKSVTSIGYNVFENCTALTDVTINATQLDIGSGNFENTGAMKVTFGEGVKKIPSYMFYSNSSKGDDRYCHIVSAKMPSTVIEIGNDAFLNCYDLKEVEWSGGLEIIGTNAFANSKLQSAVLPEGVKTIGEKAFEGNASLTKLVIPKSVTEIKERTFANCTALTDVTINATQYEVGYEAFCNTGAMNVTFGEGVKIIPFGMFYSNSSKGENTYCHIVSAEIPASVKEIAGRAFGACYDLAKVTIHSTDAAFAEDYDPFDFNLSSLTFYCYKFSTADEFAGKHNFKVSYMKANEEPGVNGFVNRLYLVCLGRTPDAAGKADWAQQLTSYRISGTSAAKGFIFSKEFEDKRYDYSDYVEHLYKAFMGRNSDEEGKKDWVSKLENGKMDQEQVFYGFANSVEFDKICNSYGIVSKDVETFVTRLYSVCLDRKPDNAGLSDWSTKLRGKAATGRGVAYGFVFSKEFQDKKYSNEDYVEHLYAAFMGRASDPAGKADWVGKLNGGMSREAVFDGFVGSKEFTDICAGYGIDRG